jgi:hypothetical protein
MKFENNGGNWGQAGTRGGGLGISGALGIAKTATITINTFNGGVPYWNSSDIDHNAHTLLHELGHAYDVLGGSGGTVLQSPDDGILASDKAGPRNDYKVDQACFGGRLGYADPDKQANAGLVSYLRALVFFSNLCTRNAKGRVAQGVVGRMQSCLGKVEERGASPSHSLTDTRGLDARRLYLPGRRKPDEPHASDGLARRDVIRVRV